MGRVRAESPNREAGHGHRRAIGAGLAFSALAVALIGWLATRTTHPLPEPPAAEAEHARVAPSPEPAAEPVPAAVAPAEAVEPPPSAPPAPDFQVVEGSISRGHSLASALGSQGVEPAVIHAIASEMAPLFDFRYARAGDSYRLVQRRDGSMVEFRYEPSQLISYQLVEAGDGYAASKWEAERIRQTSRIAGVISSSLYDSVRQLGEDARLAGDFAEIFAWDVDFSNAVQPGDEFSILYERVFRVLPGGETFYEGPGRILAGRYRGVEGDHRAVYFELDEGRGGYYRPDGSSVQRQFLRAPLSYRRISSGYSLSRLHPILKVRRPHQGIDYAAPSGTPVWAVANGKVSFVGRQGGFGNLVKVRHAQGYETYYGHLSRFSKGLRVGQSVSQKQIIGYVGSTGLATGPHLDFRMKRNGKYVNPARAFSPAGPPIPASGTEAFAEVRDRLLARLDPTPLAVTNEAL